MRNYQVKTGRKEPVFSEENALSALDDALDLWLIERESATPGEGMSVGSLQATFALMLDARVSTQHQGMDA
ncbi:hypothetical protein [Breoghania sp.]|uniref:hypothetical protein n=1 Tax=Breoghania sp. TaxID=2065378 RepID=UPI00262BDE23|nr:hypothetical protein [Breoghania sp.]MDJ0929555.1 hypothetical protein [Breoghania sp.]